MRVPYREHLKSSADLKTSYAEIRAGFVSLALEKNRKATPYIAQARALKQVASNAKSASDLLKLKDIRVALIAASGISDKANNHLSESDRSKAIRGLIRNFLEPAGDSFVEELVFRFLLTKGDTLGGSMRNVGGELAQRKLTRSLLGYLGMKKMDFHWRNKKTKKWVKGSPDQADIELFLRGLSWVNEKGPRTLIYNCTLPIVKNNIDLCLLDVEYTEVSKSTFTVPSHYIALGELKGGIDPAGADEHWKTARTALERIRKAFDSKQVHTFFVGAAIETKMASEIWTFLSDGTLENAANLADDNQVASIVRWLCKL